MGRPQVSARRFWAVAVPLSFLLVALPASCRREVPRAGQGTRPAPTAPHDPYEEARRAMVDRLRAEGITDERVLKVMLETPRHEFVPESQRSSAYEDRPLPIGEGQTISAPYIVAFMTWKLGPKPTDTVLEVGTGSGYQAAVLAPLVKHVYTIEIVEPLGKSAEERLAEMDYGNVTVRIGDGYRGWAEWAPFDKIIVTCAPAKPPQPLVDQLKEGGVMVIPCGELGRQDLYLLEKRGGKVEQRAILPVLFVPMTGEAQRE